MTYANLKMGYFVNIMSACYVFEGQSIANSNLFALFQKVYYMCMYRYKINKAEVAKVEEKAYDVMYKDLQENGTKKIYKLGKTRHRRSKYLDHLTFIWDKEGKIMCEDNIQERWKQYFKTLFNIKNNNTALSDVQPIRVPIEDITEKEVTIRIDKMKSKQRLKSRRITN